MSATHCDLCGMDWTHHGTACVAGGQEPKRSLAPAAGSALPCPFCGSTDIGPQESDTPEIIICRYCQAVGPSAGTGDDALRYWNERHTPNETGQARRESPRT